jgi:hypothetical protein
MIMGEPNGLVVFRVVLGRYQISQEKFVKYQPKYNGG